MLADGSHSAFVILIIFSKLFGRRNANASTAESLSRYAQPVTNYGLSFSFIVVWS